MKLEEVARVIDGKILIGEEKKDLEIDKAYAADLLSDVLALTEESTTLITGTVSPQVIRVAEILNIPAIIFVRGKKPTQKILEYAKEAGIPIIATNKTMFETCGILYSSGVRPCRNRPATNIHDDSRYCE